MEINKTSQKSRSFTTNPEGSIVLTRSPEIQLYLEASNLNIKEDKFYESADKKLANLIELAKTSNNEYLLGLSRFLADNGLKLSPVVLLSVLSSKGFSFRNKDLSYIFNTPQRIAEAVSLNKTLKLNNSFKKHILKTAFENLSEFTLKKNQLKSRKIKTRDLIKFLNAKPKNDKISKLYKDIIEMKAKFEDVSFIRKKSDKKASTEDKLQYLEDNIDKIPINELIRNLRFISDNAGFLTNQVLQVKVLKRLQAIDNFRYLNIFDLIETCIHVPELEKMLFEIIKNFITNCKKEFDYPSDATFLFDASGSMDGEGVKKGFKYLVLLSLIFENSELRFFGNNLWDKSKSKGILELIRKGKINEAFKRFDCPEGTALLQSIRELVNEKLREDEEINTLVIISDEVSWVEGEDLTGEIEDISKLLRDKKVILINPVVYKGTCFKNNIMAFASLTSAIIYNVALFINPDKFIQVIKEYGKD